MALLGVAALQACGDATGPTPEFVGNYTFVVEASTVCELSAERYTWELVGTSAGPSDTGGRYLLVLPGGNPAVSVSLSYATVTQGRRGGNTRQVFNTSVNIHALVATDLRVRFNGSSRATASVAADGRGEILDGVMSGAIELTDGTQRPPTVRTCTAADHRWTLTPH
jgi:hypothetical protein